MSMIRLTAHRTASAFPNHAAVFALVAAAAVAAPLPALGQASPYPAKPVRIVVPTAPGGGVDILSRLMGQKLHPSLPVNSVKELVAFARAGPAQLDCGSAGAGSASHSL